MDRSHLSETRIKREAAFTRLETITTVAVCGVLALALGLIALAMPISKSSHDAVSYRQSGTFSYDASASAGSVYGPEGLSTGEPILSGLAGPVTARFGYRFSAPAGAEVRGTARMVATVHTAGGLTRAFTMAATAPYSGRRTSVSGVLPLGAILAYVHQAELASGGTISSSTVLLTPRVTVRGMVDGQRLTTSFAPTLSFDVDGSTLRPTQPPGGGDPSVPLRPTKSGRMVSRTVTTNTVPLALIHPAVSRVRAAGLGIAVACLLLALWLARPLLRSGGAGGESVRIRALYGSRLVDVRSLALRDGPVADVSGMDALAEIAKRYESMILHVADPEAYLVWDNGMLYRYRPVTTLRTVTEQDAREA